MNEFRCRVSVHRRTARRHPADVTRWMHRKRSLSVRACGSLTNRQRGPATAGPLCSFLQLDVVHARIRRARLRTCGTPRARLNVGGRPFGVRSAVERLPRSRHLVTRSPCSPTPLTRTVLVHLVAGTRRPALEALSGTGRVPRRREGFPCPGGQLSVLPVQPPRKRSPIRRSRTETPGHVITVLLGAPRCGRLSGEATGTTRHTSSIFCTLRLGQDALSVVVDARRNDRLRVPDR